MPGSAAASSRSSAGPSPSSTAPKRPARRAPSRLGALRAGRFGAVLDGDGPALDLEEAAAEPGITYISLPALASSADLRMMGRVLLHDLKLLAHLRLDPARRPRPCLVVLDEFSALDDPDNVRDFLRQ